MLLNEHSQRLTKGSHKQERLHLRMNQPQLQYMCWHTVLNSWCSNMESVRTLCVGPTSSHYCMASTDMTW